MKASRPEVAAEEAVVEAEIEEEEEYHAPAPRAPTAPPKHVDKINEDFGGIGNVQTFLPAIVLSQDGEFEFKVSGETKDDLVFTPIRGRDCLSHWDDEAQVFIKSYDGKFDEDGDDFSPYVRKAKKTYELECMQEDPGGDGGEELHLIRCSPSMAIVFKSIAADLSKYDISVKGTEFVATPRRAKSKKHRVKFWVWGLECEALKKAQKATAKETKEK